MVWAVMFLALVVLLVLFGAGLNAVDVAGRDNRLEAARLRSEQMYREALETRTQDVRRFRHDVNGLLQAIEFAGEDRGAGSGEGACAASIADAWEGAAVLGAATVSVAGAVAAVDGVEGVGVASTPELDGATGAVCAPISEGNSKPAIVAFASAGPCPRSFAFAVSSSIRKSFPLVAAIIGLKLSQCAEAGIDFRGDVADDFAEAAAAAGASEADLCALVQNLLENAYEENLRIADPAQRAMELRMIGAGGVAVVEVANRTASDERPTFQTSKAHPDSHGVGLRVVDQIAAKFGTDPHVSFDPQARTIRIRVALGSA